MAGEQSFTNYDPVQPFLAEGSEKPCPKEEMKISQIVLHTVPEK